MGSKGSNKTTQAYTPAAATGAAGNQALQMSQTAASAPFQQPIAPVAGFSDDQLSAFANMRQHQGAAQPYMGRAAQLFDQSANPISGQQVGNYLNPFANYVMSGMENLFGQQRKDQTGRLVQSAGGQGADRIALAQGNLAREQGQAAGQTLSGIYGQALGAAQQDASRQQAAGFGFGQLGPAIQNALMSGTQGLFNFGGIQQQQQQAQMNAPYQNELARIAYPFQTAQFLGQQTAQTAPALGGTTTNTYPAPSPWGTIAGLGMAGLGAFMGNPGMMAGGIGGLFGGGQQMPYGAQGGSYGNQPGQWNPNVPGGFNGYAANGGAVPYKYGGAVDIEDIGGSYQDGGFVDSGGTSLEFDPNWDNFDPNRFGAFGAPLPQSIGPEPPQQPQMPGPMGPMPPGPQTMSPPGVDRSKLPPQFFSAEDPGTNSMPPNAMSMAPTQAPQPRSPQASYPGVPPPMPPLQPVNYTPIDIPPDQNVGGFARSPWLGLMNAGLATMAAAGERDSRGLPLPPFAAIGKGGQKGVEVLREQDKEASNRRRIEFEANRLRMAADESRRQAESHPLELQTRELTNARSAQTLAHDAQMQPLKVQDAQQGIELRGEAGRRAQDLHPANVTQGNLANDQTAQAIAQNEAMNPLRRRQLLNQVEQDEKEFPYKLEGLKRAKEKEDMAILALQNTQLAMGSKTAMEAIGLSMEDARSLGPAGVQQRLMALAGSKYSFKELQDGTLLALNIAQPDKSVVIRGTQGAGIEPNPPRAGAPGSAASAPAPAQRPNAARPGQPTPAGRVENAFGVPGAINQAAGFVQGLATGNVTPGVAQQQEIHSKLQMMNEKVAQVVQRSGSRQLSQEYKNVQAMLAKPGQLFQSWPKARAAYNSVDDAISSEVASNIKMLESGRLDKNDRSNMFQKTSELVRLQQELRETVGITAQGEGRPQQGQQQLPAEVSSRLREGVATTFSNGQVWTLRDGKPVQVK